MTLKDYLFLAVMFAMVVNASAIYDYAKGTSRLHAAGLAAYCSAMSVLSLVVALMFWLVGQ